MKRLTILLVISVPLFGLTRPLARDGRIAVLRMDDQYSDRAEQIVARTIQNDLRGELQSRGFNAFDARATFVELQRGDGPAADYYVEVVSSRAGSHPVGGAGADVGPVAVDVAVVVSRVAAELRLYDGRTLELLERYDLQGNKTAVVPTAVGLGSRSFWTFIALPFVEHRQYRSAAHEVARQAADRIAER